MAWMIDTQLGRRNLTPVQRIAVAERYKSRIQKKAKENIASAGKMFSPKEGLSKRTEVSINPISTRKELAKIAKVGSGTMARYDVVMKSDDEDVRDTVSRTKSAERNIIL